jgi:hypothetical protein
MNPPTLSQKLSNVFANLLNLVPNKRTGCHTLGDEEDEDSHTGRGGQGNAQLSGPQGTKHPEGLADKLKNKLFKKKAAKDKKA